MVFTRRGRMDKTKEKETDEQNSRSIASASSESIPSESTLSELSGSSIKVTLKKTRSTSSSSSRESTQSFEVVKNISSVPESISEGEYDENKKNISDQKNFDGMNKNEKDLQEESQNANKTINAHEDVQIDLLSSDDSQESFTEKSKSVLPVKDENKEDVKLLLDTEVHLKSEEIVQNSIVLKNENKIKVKSLKEELLKEVDSENDVVSLLKDDDDDYDDSLTQSQNGVEKNDIKVQKFTVNVRSANDLIAPGTVIDVNNLLNIPPGQIDGSSNFIAQNGAPFAPQFINMSCDICGIQFDSPDLLNEHKSTMKHYKCSFNKDCETVVIGTQQEFLDHQRMVHNIMPSPVQQLAHQVQRLPAMGYEQQLKSGVPPVPENLALQPPVPNMYTQSIRMRNQSMPMQRPMRPLIRPSISPISSRGRNIHRSSRGRPPVVTPISTRGGGLKRPATMPTRSTPPPKRVNTDRNSFTNNSAKNTQVVKSLSESLTKSLTSMNKTPYTNSTQQDVVNLFSKRGLTISTVDTVNNITLPAGISLNSAVSIIPTSPLKSVDTVDLTGPDNDKKLWPCELCTKTFSTSEILYEHISFTHKSVVLPFKCSSCPRKFPNKDILTIHRQTYHKSETVTSNNISNTLIIPILDLNKAGTASRLQSMGITNYLPVSQMNNQGGEFAIPIMTNTPRQGSLDNLKYTHYLNLGSLRKI